MNVSSSRIERERSIVRRKLPSNTRFLAVGGTEGWVYDLVCEFGNQYTMFVYWDGSMYKVKMVYPDPGSLPDDVHKHHYFRNGVICLTSSVGYARLEDAYAKSVLFATAWSAFQETGEFEF